MHALKISMEQITHQSTFGNVDMFVGIGLEVHDQNNNYSAIRKNAEAGGGSLFYTA